MQKRHLLLLVCAMFPLLSGGGMIATRSVVQLYNDGYHLVFSDEFNQPDGSKPDAT